MPIVQITGPGLAGIAISVALLWGCVIGERRMADRAFTDRLRVMHDVQRLQKRHSEPVSVPTIARPRHVQVTVG